MALDVDVQAIVDEATADTTVEDGATTLINGFAAVLAAAIANASSLSAADRANLQAVVTKMKSSSAALSAAVAANTPAAPPVG